MQNVLAYLKKNWPDWGVHIVGWLPLLWLLYDFYTDNLTINPIQAAEQRTGKDALIFLTLSLAITPLNTITGWRDVIKLRRWLGLYAFFYAAVHFTIFVWLDYGLDLELLTEVIFEKPYALVGLTAFVLLAPLALTSTKGWMKRMGKWWKRLHKLVYVIAVLVLFHYFWVAKGDLFGLSGDIIEPLVYTGIIALLLIARVPPIRKGLITLRQRVEGAARKQAVQRQNPVKPT